MTVAPPPVDRASSVRLSETTLQALVMAGVLTALTVITGLLQPNFFTAFSLRSMARDVAISSIYALGQAVAMIAGGIDLSVGSLICFFGVAACLLLQSDAVGPGIAVTLILLTAGAIGAMHGMLTSGLGLQPFLVTLCSLLIFRGLARVATHDRTVSFAASEHPWLRTLGAGLVGGVPTPVWILLAVMAPLAAFMHLTTPGRYLYAIGSNPEAARYSGVPVNRLRLVSYVISATLAAIAALLELGDVGSLPPSSAGVAYEMYGITGAVLGGCALAGGRGSLVGVVIGMAILRVIKSAVIFAGLSTYWTFAATGLVLLFAVVVDALVRRRRTEIRRGGP